MHKMKEAANEQKTSLPSFHLIISPRNITRINLQSGEFIADRFTPVFAWSKTDHFEQNALFFLQKKVVRIVKTQIQSHHRCRQMSF